MLEYTLYTNGGKGIFACPDEATEKMLSIRDFLSKAVSNRIDILNVETGKLEIL